MIKATEILKFFIPDHNNVSNGKITPKSLGNFFSTIKDTKNVDVLQLALICKKLENEGLLIQSGTKHEQSPPLSNCYYCFDYRDTLAEYGTYEFIVYGFPHIRKTFSESVRPIVIKYDKDQDIEFGIGTYFIIGDNVIVTAKHCLPTNASIKITNPLNEIVPIRKISVPQDDKIDIAIVLTEGEPFKGLKHFSLGIGNILDEVITMGYPSIPGFEVYSNN